MDQDEVGMASIGGPGTTRETGPGETGITPGTEPGKRGTVRAEEIHLARGARLHPYPTDKSGLLAKTTRKRKESKFFF